MNILTIDTSTDIETIAVCSNGKISDQTSIADRSHSATMFNNIDIALKDLGISMDDIGLIGVGIGPGSFTGIRIAVTTARMLAQILKIPTVGIKTPLIYACSADAAAGENIIIAFDAKKGRVFGALYKMGGDNTDPIEIVAPGDYHIETLAERIDPSFRTHIIGRGIGKYHDKLSNLIQDPVIPMNFLPSGKIACSLTEKIYNNNPDEFMDYNRTLPLYSRKSDAEVEKDKKNRNIL